jgi:uncharacterized protein YebE (UPF0316 family)
VTTLAFPIAPGLLPLLIFLAETCVVTIGTVRIIFVARGLKYLAPLLGFFEVLTWLFAISQIMQNLSNGACFLAFAAGFALGNFLGVLIEKKLAMGSVLVRVITRRDAGELARRLRAADFGVTIQEGEGATGRVRVLITAVRRKEVERVVALIKQHDPQAFYSIDELQHVAEGIFPARRPAVGGLALSPLQLLRACRARLLSGGLDRQGAKGSAAALIHDQEGTVGDLLPVPEAGRL